MKTLLIEAGAICEVKTPVDVFGSPRNLTVVCKYDGLFFVPVVSTPLLDNKIKPDKVEVLKVRRPTNGK